MREFGAALAGADEVVLTDIYAASEDPIPGVTVEALAEAVNAARGTPVHVIRDVSEVPAALAALAKPGDMVITLGAGSIGAAPRQVVEALQQRFGSQQRPGDTA
jgi:UDP-N-acetylmuramate--alanine ligase